MKKIITFSLCLLVSASAFAQDAAHVLLKRRAVKAERRAQLKELRQQSEQKRYVYKYDPHRIRSRDFGIGAVALAGSGAIVLIAGTMMSGAGERDPAKFAKIVRDRRTVMITGGSMMVASLPLAYVSLLQRKKLKDKFRIGLYLEPVRGCQGRATHIAALGLRMGL